MQTPRRHEGPPTSIRRSKRLIRRTKPIESVSEHVSEFERAAASFENRYDEWIRSRHEALIAIGARHEAQEDLDQEIRSVGLAVLTVGRGRRNSEIYRLYFPEGYGRTLRRSPQASLAIAAGLLAAMGDESAPAILALREPLAAARAHLESAMANRQAAADAASRAKAIFEEEKLAWRKAVDKFYFALRTSFSDRRSFVEALFRAADSRRHPEEEEDQEEAPVETRTQVGAPARRAEPGGVASPEPPLPPAAPAPPPARLTLVTTSTASTAAAGPVAPETSAGESAP